MTQLPTPDAIDAARYRAQGAWIDTPVPFHLGAWARETPEAIAVVDRLGPMCYQQLYTSVRRAAAGLWAAGLRPGDSIALQLPNWREFVIFQQAACLLGVCYVPLPPQLRGADMQYVLECCRAMAVIIPDVYRGFDHRAMMRGIRDSLPHLKATFVVGEVAEETTGTEAFLATRWEDPHGAAVDAVEVDPHALRHVLFTSGTESKPKGVCHSYNTAFFPLKLHQRYFSLDQHDVILAGSTVGHGIGALFGVELSLFLGGKVAEGYIYSGDLVEVDEAGYLRVVGRRKDIIIRGGENISPAELEEIIHLHPAVVDAAVIGIEDERLGQRACAVVILREGADLSLPDLVAFFSQRQVAKFKWPEHLEIVTEFPRTAVGKVRKDVLRARVLDRPRSSALAG